jgi:hypothetical protein
MHIFSHIQNLNLKHNKDLNIKVGLFGTVQQEEGGRKEKARGEYD